MTWYGETGKNEIEYFFEHDSLRFAHDHAYTYNRPIYWDAKHAARSVDTTVFDESRTTAIEDRYYFDHHLLVLWLNDEAEPQDLKMGTNTLVGPSLLSHAFWARSFFE